MKGLWELWMGNEKIAERDFNNFLKKKMIIKGATEIEVKGHLNKARRNLLFAKEKYTETILNDLSGQRNIAVYFK